MKTYRILGMMSGTSLDGVDMAYVELHHQDGEWSFDMGVAQTVPYPQKWKDILLNIQDVAEPDMEVIDAELGRYYGRLAESFVERNALDIDFVSAHGHTAYHRPQEGITRQIGSGEEMVRELRWPVVNDFRSNDVKLGGQGAPLVPIGDAKLFHEYDICVNLGGFANLSFTDSQGLRRAYDICPCNMPLNEVAQRRGEPYDKDGRWAQGGQVGLKVLRALENLDYYKKPFPKSLGREWYIDAFKPTYEQVQMPLGDLLATLVEHVAKRIAAEVDKVQGSKVLFTGGGALNTYLMTRIAALSRKDVHLPSDKVIDFKEALVFALLGALRWRNEVNVLASVTGAAKDHCSGVIHRV